jgi:hypothetical protein
VPSKDYFVLKSGYGIVLLVQSIASLPVEWGEGTGMDS